VLEVAAGEALVSQDRAPVKGQAFEDLGGDFAFADVRGGELKADRHAVGGTDEHEPKSPVMARVRAAPAIGRVAGELRASRGLARLAAGNRGAVKQPQPIAEGRRFVDEQVEQPDDLWRERADTLVVARLLGQIWEQVPQPPPREREKTPVAGTVQQHLRDGQADHLSVADLSWSAGPPTGHEEVICEHVKSDEERVETGGHLASKVDDARTPSVFDTSMAPPRRDPVNSESII
jgi:hypothetical protein